MSKLQISVINDVQEFVNKITIDQSDYLYVYLENIFKPINNIYDIILDIYEKYRPACIFTDTQIQTDNVITTQYYTDINHNKHNKIIFSPLVVRYLPIELQIYPNLKYHSFSFLRQLIQHVLPWHIPTIGFNSDIDKTKFQKIAQNAQWVMQQGT